jgi:hypothetical protein
VRETVDAGRGAQEVVLQLCIMTAVFRGASEKLAGNDNRGVAAKFDHFRNGF